MDFEVRPHPGEGKFLLDLDQDTKEGIKTGIKNLQANPFKSHSRSGIKKLKGTKKRDDLYRLRVGDYRVIYEVENNTIFVLEIISREKGYDWF